MTELATTPSDPVISSSERVDFELLLLQCSVQRSTGRIVIDQNGHEVGQVFLHRGRIAWATCIDQSENLGTFLQRLGHLRDEQLVTVRQEHSRRQGASKLGELLVETGLITPALLRSCLKLHLRMALTRLLRTPELSAILVEDPRSSSDSMSFPLRQLLPSWWQSPTLAGAAGPGDTACAQLACLASLNDVPGFRGAAVLDSDGSTLSRCGFLGISDDLAESVVAWAQGSLGEETQSLGSATSAFVEGEWGAVVARRLEGAEGTFVAVLLGPDGKPGTVLHRLSAITPALLHALGVEQEGAH